MIGNYVEYVKCVAKTWTIISVKSWLNVIRCSLAPDALEDPDVLIRKYVNK